MKDFELGAIQERFADIVWEHEPIASGELAKICEKELSWKRPVRNSIPPRANRSLKIPTVDRCRRLSPRLFPEKRYPLRKQTRSRE